MKVLSKKIITAALALCAIVCLCLGGLFAFSQLTSTYADTTTLETKFTNNGQFTVSQYSNVPYEYVDAETEGLTGAEGAALKITTTSGAAYICFNAPDVLATDVESIVVRIYSPTYNASDSFRSSSQDLSAGWLMNTAYTMSDWCEVTLADGVLTQMTDDSGYLSNTVMFGARSHTDGGIYYIDSITITYTQEYYEKEFTNNGQFTVSQYSNVPYEYVDAETEGLTGAEGAALKITTTSGAAYICFNAPDVLATDVESIVVRIYSPTYNASDSFRSSSQDLSAGWLMNTAYTMSDWCEVTLADGVLTQMTDDSGYLSNTVMFGARSHTDGGIYYIDSITVNMKESAEAELATFVGPWGSAAYNSSEQVLLQYSCESDWVYTDKGNLSSKITYKNSETGGTCSATDDNIAGWSGQKWIVLSGMSGYDVIEIAEGGTFGGNIEIPALTLYNVNGAWVTTAPQAATTEYTNIASGWNNSVVSGLSNNILVFDVNPLGAAADATNLAATINRTSLMVKYNGKTFYELCQSNTAYSISYAHGNNYFYFAIPEDDLVEGATFEIEEGTPFMSQYLSAVTLYCVNGYWVTTAPADSTVQFSEINATWNNLTGSDGVSSHTIITYSAVLDGASGTAVSTNLAATLNCTSLMVKYNGKTFYELYQSNTAYSISYAHGYNYFYFAIPEDDLVEGATFEIEEGTPFMSQYLPATTLYLQDGVWTDTLDTTNYSPDFVEIGTHNHYDNTGLNAYGLSLVYDTTGFAEEGVQVGATATTGITLNGEAVSAAFWGGEQLLFWFAKDKCASGYNGYSHATLVIADGATVTNANGKTFTLGGVTLYLVDGAWTTEKPADYLLTASFVDFNVNGVGGAQNHVSNGTYYQLTLDFDKGGLAFNAHASAVSGITFNGVPMTCGGAPSGDSVMVITLNSGLWIHYTSEQATAWYKNYSHPTIHFEEGATVTDANGVTMAYEEMTLYLVNGAWTQTQPDGWTDKRPLTYSSIVWNNIDYSDYSSTYDLKDGALLLIKYDNLISNDAGEYANGTNLIASDNSIGNNITVNGVALKDVDGAHVALFAGYLYIYVPLCETLVIAEGTEIYNFTLPETTFYFTDSWSTDAPTYTAVTFSQVTWNNYDYNGYAQAQGFEDGTGTPTNGFCGLFSYSADLGTTETSSNMATAYLEIGSKFTVNGVAAKDIEGAYISYNAGANYLYFYIPYGGLEAAEVYVVKIEEGAKFLNAALGATTYYFLYSSSSLSPSAPTYTAVTFSQITWNNYDYNGYAITYGDEIFTGTPTNGFCGLFSYSADLGSAATSTNMATAHFDIGSKFTVNGVAAKDIEGAYISYNAGQNYLYFYIPYSGITASDVYTIAIESGTSFLNSTLPATTHYFYDYKINDVAPVIVTVTYGEGSVSKRFNDTQVIDSAYLADLVSGEIAAVAPLVWTIDSVTYYAGDSVTVSATTTVVIQSAIEFGTVDGAAIRIANDGKNGIRFESRIGLDSYNALVEKYGESNIKTGTYIVPRYLFDQAGLSIADYFAQEQGTGSDSKYVHLSNFDTDKNANGIYNKDTYETDGYIRYFGSLTNLSEKNYYTKFFGVGYVTVTVDGKEITVYGLSDVAKTTRTIYNVAVKAYSDTSTSYSDSALSVLQGYIDPVVNLTYSNGNLFVDAEVSGRDYESVYTLSQGDTDYTVSSSTQPLAVVLNGDKIAFTVTQSGNTYSFTLAIDEIAAAYGSTLQYGFAEPGYTVWADGNAAIGNKNATDDTLSAIVEELGVSSYRIWTNASMGAVGADNVVALNTTKVNDLKAHVEALIGAGVKEILFQSGSTLLPYDYAAYYVLNNDTSEYSWVSAETLGAGGNYTAIYADFGAVPHPTDEAEEEEYATWLKVQYDYYVLFANEVQSWKGTYSDVEFYFEGLNEPEFQSVIHKRGKYEDGAYKDSYFTTVELAKILTDLSYYMTLAVGDVGYVTSPALSNISSNSESPSVIASIYCDELLSKMYAYINDGVAPTAIGVEQTNDTSDANSYFTCLNWHPYLQWFKSEHAELYYGEIVKKTYWGTTTTSAEINSSYASAWVNWNNAMYAIAVNAGHTNIKKVFFSEFGICDWGNTSTTTTTAGNYVTMGINEELAAEVFKTLLGSVNDLDFVDELTIMAFRMFDNEALGAGEGNFGFIDDDGNAKQIMKEYYAIINGTDDTSSLEAVIKENFVS